MQYLPPRQRVVLILRDVLAWRAAEVAELLDTSTVAVNSSLQRARAQLELVAPNEDAPIAALDSKHRALLEQYVKAFEKSDIAALLTLLRDDVTLEMPPETTWFAGREAEGRFIAARIFTSLGVTHLLPITANTQPAVATYQRGRDAIYHAHAVQVLTVRQGRSRASQRSATRRCSTLSGSPRPWIPPACR